VTAEHASTLALLDDHPRLLVFRTFSKIYGLAGLRAGYALGGPGSEELLARLAPELGVGLTVQIGALEALRRCDGQVTQRRAAVARERERLLDALHELPIDASPSEANVLWLRPTGLTGSELAVRLQRGHVLVMSGASVGADDHVRVTVQSAAASDRLLEALRTALGAS
jgi:histidinol-phosphate aminotransferase